MMTGFRKGWVALAIVWIAFASCARADDARYTYYSFARAWPDNGTGSDSVACTTPIERKGTYRAFLARQSSQGGEAPVLYAFGIKFSADGAIDASVLPKEGAILPVVKYDESRKTYIALTDQKATDALSFATDAVQRLTQAIPANASDTLIALFETLCGAATSGREQLHRIDTYLKRPPNGDEWAAVAAFRCQLMDKSADCPDTLAWSYTASSGKNAAFSSLFQALQRAAEGYTRHAPPAAASSLPETPRTDQQPVPAATPQQTGAVAPALPADSAPNAVPPVQPSAVPLVLSFLAFLCSLGALVLTAVPWLRKGLASKGDCKEEDEEDDRSTSPAFDTQAPEPMISEIDIREFVNNYLDSGDLGYLRREESDDLFGRMRSITLDIEGRLKRIEMSVGEEGDGEAGGESIRERLRKISEILGVLVKTNTPVAKESSTPKVASEISPLKSPELSRSRIETVQKAQERALPAPRERKRESRLDRLSSELTQAMRTPCKPPDWLGAPYIENFDEQFALWLVDSCIPERDDIHLYVEIDRFLERNLRGWRLIIPMVDETMNPEIEEVGDYGSATKGNMRRIIGIVRPGLRHGKNIIRKARVIIPL